MLAVALTLIVVAGLYLRRRLGDALATLGRGPRAVRIARALIAWLLFGYPLVMVAAVGEPAPLVLHTVGHVVHPVRPLAAWPDDDHRTRLVFIARGMSAAMLRSLLVNLSETLGQPLVAG